MSSSSAMGRRYKEFFISSQLAESALFPGLAAAAPGSTRRFERRRNQKVRCTVLAEIVALSAIGNVPDRIVRIRMPVNQFNREGYSQMKKSITLSLVLATSLGLAACGEKAADEAAPAAEDTATVEGAADGAMEAAEGAADATAAAADATANAAGDAAAAANTAADKASEAADAAKEATDAAKGAMEEAKK
ncbi:hypothetical protein [Sphingopyxis granuli]|uniref:hypothetical protein n=1 Tax=Sphingopyxis granuli TaxID=267128 RepID=UPI001FD42A3F|nr:hypothetical protein [Sphingopyxis granuli]